MFCPQLICLIGGANAGTVSGAMLMDVGIDVDETFLRGVRIGSLLPVGGCLVLLDVEGGIVFLVTLEG